MADSGTRLGPLQFAAGITRGNALTLLFSGFAVAMLLPYINFAQPYILTEHLGIPKDSQGTLSGNLAFYTEIVLILCSGFIGAWADRAGLRLVFAAGILVVGVSYLLYPLATSSEELLWYRVVYALGAAAVSAVFVAVQTDYPMESSRGKLVGTMGVLSILGVLVIIGVLTGLPARFAATGASPVRAGTWAYWSVAGGAILSAAIIAAGLARRKASDRPTASVLGNFRNGLRCARDNPRIALACSAGMVGRADLVVVTVFLALWLSQAGVEQGLTSGAALARASGVFAVVQLSALLSMPLIAFVADRIDRCAMLALATAIAAAGYLWTGTVTDPLATSALPAMALLGVGQAAAILAATALLGRESPPGASGATAGLFSLCGAVGILAITKGGGWAYDAWHPGAPFLLIGVANGVVMGLALVIWRLPAPALRPAGGT